MRREELLNHRIRLSCGVCAAMLSAFSHTHAATGTGTPGLPQAHDGFLAERIADGLQQPRGLALHPTSGEVYVAERHAGRVSVLRDGKRVTVIDDGFDVLPEIPKWALRKDADVTHWRTPKLRSPISLAFSEHGHLFVAEDASSGRLLEFIPDLLGRYRQARVVPVPWLSKPFNWDGLSVDKEGRIFLAGTAAEGGPGLLFGSVLMRDPEHVWWVIDYGPFSGFNSVCLSRHQDILVVGDRAGGGVTWWDIRRHKVIGTSEKPLPSAGHVGLLRDGTIVVSQPSPESLLNGTPAGPGGGRLLGLNPETQQHRTLATGFGEISGAVYAPQNDCLYVSDAQTGSVYSFRATEPQRKSDYHLRRSLYRFEMSQGMAPRQWPQFLEDFVSRLGIQTLDEFAVDDGKDLPENEDMVFSVREFTDRIPMIAGRLKVLSDSVVTTDEDPVSQVDFVVFYPGKTLVSGANATPSLSLFSARHASGKVEQTRVLGGFKSHRRAGGRWAKQSDQALLYFPMATCTTQRQRDGMDLTLAFLGMGHLNDYYVEIECGKIDRGHMMVEGESGRLADYDVEFTELDDEGEEVRNIMIAGFEPEESDDYTWLRIGKEPIDTQLRFDEQARGSWVSYRLAAFKPLIEQKDLEMRMVRWDSGSTERTVQTPGDAPTVERGINTLPDGHAEGVGHPHTAPRQTRLPGDEDHANAPFPGPVNRDLTRARPDEADHDGATSWTNLILTRAIDAWSAQGL